MKALIVDPADNVAVVAQAAKPGDLLEAGSVTIKALDEIPTGHKAALTDIAAGEMVIKYGVPIGKAICDIKQGAFVHTHNLEDITTELCEGYALAFRRKAGVL